ncbi:MAG: FAD-dependent pyridine nucleotide-disulfide oxidoreductase [Rhodocyclaceae bacterium]|nr:MAG: FAD-dependent pyridine nucleotide-disulfide oxidoreductase [Rhodocyclaceae bacterium]TND03746.1 MAG: FAD-dependent pyridine nucleotide-disulfide oxidoreductase [Rhodocyclaceae bacterium]
MRHVIIGAGPAGITAAETLRKLDAEASITVLDGEGEVPYARMAIPYLLSDQIGEDGTHLSRDADHYSALRIDIEKARAAAVDTATGAVRLTDGRVIPYDRLLIASGSVPSRESIEGIDLPGVHTCWTLADARAIVDEIHPGARIVQMGAGFVGCIIMHGLVSRGAQLTVLVRSGRVVSRMMPPKASEMIARWCEAKGVHIMGKTQAARIDRDGEALKVTLTTGEVLPADIYLSVVGVKPGIDFLTGSGIAVETGIVVDEHLRTNVPGVYAVGDAAESRDRLYGKLQMNAIQPNAVEQARIAAMNMAGGDTEFLGSLAINVLDTMGLISCSFGQWQGEPGGESVEQVDEADYRYLSLQFGGECLVGATTVGFTDHVGALRGLIQGKVKLGAWRERLLADPSLFMSAHLAMAEKLA